MKRWIHAATESTEEDLIKIPYKRSMASGYKVNDHLKISIQKTDRKWTASVLDLDTLDTDFSIRYSTPTGLDNFFKKYGIEIVFPERA